MTWAVVAKKDFQDSIRSYWLIGLSVLFTLVVSLFAAFVGLIGNAANATSSQVITLLNGFVITTLVPLLALVVSYGAVVGERESGSLKLLLALPHSRTDVVVGKLLGRTAAVTVAVFVGFLLPSLLIGALVPFQFAEYVGYMLLVAVLAATFVSIGLGISASTKTQFRSIAAMLTYFIVFVIMWAGLIFALAYFVIPQVAGSGGWPTWMPVDQGTFHVSLRVINPTGAFKIVSAAFLNGLLFSPEAANSPAAKALGIQVAALGSLGFWLTAPIAVGIWRFNAADL